MKNKAYNTMVISCFPGCGKTEYYKYENVEYPKTIFDKKVLDSDSSNFSWIKDNEGNNTKERNLDFPNNYIKHIKNNIGKVDIIFVSSHKVVRDALKENNINYTLVYPKMEAKKQWLKRFVQRGDSEQFIKFIDVNWEGFIKEMQEEDFPNHKVLDGDTYMRSFGVMSSIKNANCYEIVK